MLFRRARTPLPPGAALRPLRNPLIKIVSWNLLRLTGASLDDVVRLALREQPDDAISQAALVRLESPDVPRAKPTEKIDRLVPIESASK